jgi:acyl-CoA synthetase (NDP forming)
MPAESTRNQTVAPLPVDPRLRLLFDPASIAVVGASANPARIGARVLRFLADGGYSGSLMAVNPARTEIQGKPCYPSITDLPEVPDLTVLAVSAAQTRDALVELGRRGGRAAICMAAGFREESPEGAAMERELTAVAREAGITVLGPNSVGFRNTSKKLYAAFATDIALGPLPGSVAILSQSGGLAGYLGAAVAKTRGIGYRWIIDTGNEIDVDIADCISYLSEDEGVSAIGLITEGCGDGDRLRAAFESARLAGKPVIAFKLGRTALGARSAASHTGALAGTDAIYDAVFEQHGVHRVRDEHEFIEALGLYDLGQVPKGRNVAVFSLSGGVATLLADACAERGLQVPPLPPPPDPEIHAKLPSARFDNPLDLSGQIGSEPDMLRAVLEHVLSQPQIDSAVLGFAYMLQAKHISDVFVPAIVAAQQAYGKPVVVNGLANAEAERTLREHGIVVEAMGVDAVGALAVVTGSREPQDAHGDPAHELAGAVAAGRARAIRTGPAAVALLPGIAFAETVAVATADDAVDAAGKLGWPVVAKVDGGSTAHKSELGLVRVGLATQAELRAAFAELSAKRETLGDGTVVIQPQLEGVEIALGVHRDPTFGPVVMIGLGGIFIEQLNDVAFGLPPLSPAQAEQMLRRLRGWPLLAGARGRPPVHIGDLVDAIVQLSNIATAERGRIAEIDINPFVARAEPGRSAAADALVVLEDEAN